MSRWWWSLGVLAACASVHCSSDGDSDDDCDSCAGGSAGEGVSGATTGGSGGAGAGKSGTSGGSGGSGGVAGSSVDAAGEAGMDSSGTGGGAGSGSGGTSTGGSAGSGSGGTGGAGATMQPAYLLWANASHVAAIMKLDPVTGTVTDTKPAGNARGFGTNLAVAPDGTVRVMWSVGAEVWLDIFDIDVERVDTRTYVFAGSTNTWVFSKGPDGGGMILSEHSDGIHVNELDEDDELTGIVNIYHAGPRPLDYRTLPSTDARVLTTPEPPGTTSIIPVDRYGDPIGEPADCENPGWRSISYAVAQDGTVWVSYTRDSGLEARVCAYTNEESFDCDLTSEGWGPGGCTTYTHTDTTLWFADFGIAP